MLYLTLLLDLFPSFPFKTCFFQLDRKLKQTYYQIPKCIALIIALTLSFIDDNSLSRAVELGLSSIDLEPLDEEFVHKKQPVKEVPEKDVNV